MFPNSQYSRRESTEGSPSRAVRHRTEWLLPGFRLSSAGDPLTCAHTLPAGQGSGHRALCLRSLDLPEFGLHLRQGEGILRQRRKGPGMIVHQAMSTPDDTRFCISLRASNDTKSLHRLEPATETLAGTEFPARIENYPVRLEKAPYSFGEGNSQYLIE